MRIVNRRETNEERTWEIKDEEKGVREEQARSSIFTAQYGGMSAK